MRLSPPSPKPYTSIMFAFPISKLKAWDDKGFSYTLPQIGESGQITLTYRNTYTWAHTEVSLPYMSLGYPIIAFDYITLRVDVYVGS